MEKNNSFYRKHLANGLPFCLVWSVVLNLIIETFARKYFGGIEFLLQHPVVFFYNAFIIFATLSVACMFRRRRFFIIVISAIWLAVGITNGIILMERMTPFTVKDLSAMTDAATILTNYFNKAQLTAIATLIIAVVVGITLLWVRHKGEKPTVRYRETITAVVLITAMTFGGAALLVKAGYLSTFFGNLAYAYEDFGVPYCFINTWLNTGIHKPDGYSQGAVAALFPKDKLDANGHIIIDSEDVDEDYPNIIFLQLESFTDPRLFNNIELSEDAIPYFRSLSQRFSSGYLMVPACGAGTANTEFEIMTGISVKFFGPGEYPFKGILKTEVAESVPFDLKNLGFSTHAIHNHRAMFYNRNTVYANIGYDTFTSVEYMSDVPKTPKNWAKDKILTRQIMDALKSTDSHDYIYTVSVQGHGKYPPEQLIADPDITVTSAPDEATKWRYEYFVNQIHEMDEFVEDLTTTLSDYDERVILVMYGDHIPALDITKDTYKRDLYETPYVIWANYDLKKVDMDIHAYELSAEVLGRIGIHSGTVTTYQQNADHADSGFLSGLKLLGYDMLYGDRYIYGGKVPFERTKMKMGVKPVKIDSVVKVGDAYYIKGENFTEYSKVTLRGETLSTIYLSPTLLALEEKVDPDDAAKMKVSQIDKTNKEIISSTE